MNNRRPAATRAAHRGVRAGMLLAWGTLSGEAANPLRSLVHTHDTTLGWGLVNRGRYSNPALDGAIAKAMAIADDREREQVLIAAQRIAIDDVAVIPLHIQKNIWAMRADLTYAARADEATLAMELRPAGS